MEDGKYGFLTADQYSTIARLFHPTYSNARKEKCHPSKKNRCNLKKRDKNLFPSGAGSKPQKVHRPLHRPTPLWAHLNFLRWETAGGRPNGTSFLLCATLWQVHFGRMKKCPPNRCLLWQSYLFLTLCLTSCPQNGCLLCERCCKLWFSVWYNDPKWMFLCRVQCDTLFWLKQNASRNGCLSRQMFSMCHSFFVKAKCPRNGWSTVID